MSLDKQLYWERRAKGLRGQGDYPPRVAKHRSVREWKLIKRAERLERDKANVKV